MCIREKISNISIKIKFFLIICIAIFLVAFTAFFAMFFVIKKNNEMLYSATESSLFFSVNEIKNSLDSISNKSRQIIADKDVQKELTILANTKNVIASNSAYRDLYNTLINYSYNSPFIKSINIYKSDSSIISNTSNVHSSKESLEFIIEEALNKKGGLCWLVLPNEKNSMILARSIRKIDGFTLEDLGVLILYVDIPLIIKNSTNFDSMFNDISYLLSYKNEIFFRSEKLQDISYKQFLHENEKYGIFDYNNNSYFAIRNVIPNYDIEYQCLMNYDKPSSNIKWTYQIFTFSILTSILISIIFSNILSQNIIKHFNSLIIKTSTFRGEVFEVTQNKYDYSKRRDEIGIVHRNFDHMAHKIQTLINENYIATILMKDAKLRALENQINPHFLYNTLESINWRAKSIGELQISQIVEALGNVLRVSLNDSYSIIALSQEIDFINNYIVIQRYRFGSRLQFHIDIDKDLMNISIPKLSIQPLVENAIKYSLEQIIEECHIYISATKNKNFLNIYVKNNGSQFEEDLLEKLFLKEVEPNGFGIGLKNINSRIKLTFGEESGLTVYNEDDYAVAKIIIPYRGVGLC